MSIFVWNDGLWGKSIAGDRRNEAYRNRLLKMTFESQRQNNVKKSRKKSRKKDKGLGDIHLTLCLLVRPKRFELLTPWFVAKYSIQLSYGRVKLLLLL